MSALGQGSLGLTPGSQMSGAPFTPTSANNGVSVDPTTKKIVLGDSLGGILAKLLGDRYIDTANGGFSIYIVRTSVGDPNQVQILNTGVIATKTTNNQQAALSPATLQLADPAFNQPVIIFDVANNAKRRIINNTNGTIVFADESNSAIVSIDKTTGIKTDPANTGGMSADNWQFGARQAGAVALDGTQYLEVRVGGTVYKLGIVS